MPRRKNEPKKKYLVDYDIPRDVAGRKQFYRKLRELKLERSSESVVLTDDPEKASAIQKKASSLGRAHKYRVVRKKN
jgi:hypothetical protein